ncbi:GNAT family N-acetyltransferase [Romboutsia sedimentorum]|uniref:GNAT family N-acetyltransferase n=1 Tax=Romboutsia sedimentorum TaxID=1368474 RepID=A0ABT7E6L5_9FIRM|nr:GNAT family N-acetyltransferase [Romboutsia sedimentorum]MDK2562575.1 GNAT family N-acetyltransferase [Romboutsia sedimentorum]
MNYKIKKFSELENSELYQILELRCEVFVVEQNCAYNDVDNKDQDAYHLLLEDNKKIIAGLRILKKGVSYDQISIGRVVVSKEHRGLGIAKEMMLKAIEFIENDLNEKEIKISAQAYLIDFYKSIGFVEVSQVYLEDDIPHIDMLYKK